MSAICNKKAFFCPNRKGYPQVPISTIMRAAVTVARMIVVMKTVMGAGLVKMVLEFDMQQTAVRGHHVSCT